MTAYNVVRFKVKAEREDELINLYRDLGASMEGMRKTSVIKTGDRSYCVIGEWDSMEDIVNARPELSKRLDSMREMLEDLGGGLGVTDPVSGEVIVEHLKNNA